MDTHSIKDMLRPSSETVNTIQQWLSSHGISEDVTVDSDWLYFTTTVSKAEEMLNTKYENFRDTSFDTIATRVLAFSLPSHIKPHINMIHPTTSFALARPKKTAIHYRKPVSADVSAASCGFSVTPACLASLYGYASYKPSVIKAVMGVAGFLEQWPQKPDFKSFLQKYVPGISSSTTFKCTLINGGLCSSTTNENDIDEANLDVQYAQGISGNIPLVYYSTGGRPPINGGGTNTNEPYLQFLNFLMNQTTANLPTTVSISYGDDESTVPLSYANTVCNLFAQVGARGVSFLAASGDSGIDCESGTLNPTFPGGCPFVTTVGGTTSVSPERAVDFSGGGFSNYFAQPSYQSTAVKNWIAGNHNPGLKGKFNASGRAYPDVSAQASGFRVILDGSDSSIGGTSASTPTFASIIDLVSNALLAQGKKPLGFLNPFLYASGTAQGFTDITSGSNEGCSSDSDGFSAVQGWDVSFFWLRWVLSLLIFMM